jgi:tRNA nucleotidyltransferase (CCA-adding enzyme)
LILVLQSKKMNQRFENVLKEAILESKPSREEIKKIDSYLKEFLVKFRKKLGSLKIDAELFVGGSFAKKTLIKKEKYDVDIFVRFDKKYIKNDISELTLKTLNSLKLKNNIIRIHGSRDYFKVDIEPGLYFEIVPVMKVTNPKNAENITDLSYYHVKYINKKINEKLSDDIILAKSFCHANNAYGAESHIKGFSGYSLELLVSYYKGFLNFISEIAKSKEDKIIIDAEKYYPTKKRVLIDMNSSKLESPIILVDPTYKERNALATLSNEVFKKFKETCKNFLKNPDISYFRIKETDLNVVEKSAKKKGYDFLLLKISTNKQEGSVAGSKLLKFYNYLNLKICRYFEIKEKGFFYRDKKDADFFFIVKRKNNEIIKGPPENKEEEVMNFKSKHKDTFVKSGTIYAEEKIDFNLREFIHNWKEKDKRIIKEMYITNIKILD